MHLLAIANFTLLWEGDNKKKLSDLLLTFYIKSSYMKLQLLENHCIVA